MKWFQIDCFCLYCLLALEDTCQKKFEGESRRVVSVETQHNLLNVLKERACQLSMSEWQRIEIWSILVRFSSFFCDAKSYWVSFDYDTEIWWKRGWERGKKYIIRIAIIDIGGRVSIYVIYTTT